MIEKLQFSQILIVTRKNGEKKLLWQARRLQLIRGKKKKSIHQVIISVFFEPFNQERRKIKWYPVCKVWSRGSFRIFFAFWQLIETRVKGGWNSTRSRSLVIPRTCQKRGLTSGNRLARLRRLGHDAAPAENRRFAGHN